MFSQVFRKISTMGEALCAILTAKPYKTFSCKWLWGQFSLGPSLLH